MAVHSFKDLVVWQKSFRLVIEVYEVTNKLPSDEKFGLTSQARRSAVSIPSSIAEGQSRHNIKEYRQFIGIAEGSAAELETQMLLISELYKIDISSILIKLEEIQKMLYSLSKKLAPTT